ncbi:MAG: single-stranded DNA-binding protein [Coriobacteriales bacterium]|jgi:single-stranded DNA-binding protein|nr:single-stranded DNA-binding protein [Coriobacteriales bacterium]
MSAPSDPLKVNSVALRGTVTQSCLRATAKCEDVLCLTIDTGEATDGAEPPWQNAAEIGCVLRGEQAWPLSRKVATGAVVGAQGRLRQVTYEDRSGRTRHRIEVVLDDVTIIRPPPGPPAGAAQKTPADRYDELWKNLKF